MKRILARISALILAAYVLLCVVLYFNQEKLIFFPAQLPADHRFSFPENFEELVVPAGDGKKLNALLFRSDSSTGVVLYLHGNAGSLETWGRMAGRYLAMRQDILILDYRGFGKSEGEVCSENLFYADAQSAYALLKQRYAEDRISVVGYSIGTATAAWLASVNHPRMLVLQAPYYSLTEMLRLRFPFVPSFLLKYKFPTADFVEAVQVPVAIFHGDADQTIPVDASLRLKARLKPSDTLVILPGQGHNEMNDNLVYLQTLNSLLQAH